MKSRIFLLLMTVAAGSAWAQEKKPAPPAPAAAPSLDELLDLPVPARPDAPKKDDAAVRPTAVEEGPDEPFTAAVAEMKLAADKLSAGQDAGLETQRIQQKVIDRLDRLIEELKKQQQQNSSQGKSGQGRQQDTGSAQNQGQNQGQRSGQGRQQAGSGTEAAQGAGGRGQAQTRAVSEEPLAETLSEWGALPPHLRGELLQGLEDRFSQLYRILTERYYRRLAEEKKP